MSFSKVYSAQTIGLRGRIIDVETDISKKTLHAFTIVGLPDKAVEESRDRVSAAIKNSGFKSPKSRQEKVVVSLAPADIKKEGPFFDSAIALSFLLAEEDISFDPNEKLFLGELALDGALRPVKGVLPIVLEAKRSGFKEIFVPEENAREAALISGISIYGAKTLNDIVNHLSCISEKNNDEKEISAAMLLPFPKTAILPRALENEIDIGDIIGQETAKRGLEIAAAGGHNICMYGPPGTGKTMLAKAFSSLLPDLSFDDVLEVTGIHSVAGILSDDFLVTRAPFRSPHHSASFTSVVGGGTIPKPGEITLAHKGVLFLDEFPEFDRRVIESLRQPLEDKVISISRVRGMARFPADVILVAAMNPCPCGYYGVSNRECACSASDISRYRKKISGPIMDRIDMWIYVGAVSHEELLRKDKRNTKDIVEAKRRVALARAFQKKRFSSGKTNASMSVRDISKYISLDENTKKELDLSAGKMNLSARAYHKVLKLARTLADLEGDEQISFSHISEAIGYRPRSDN